jgi:aryl-alcohol dehydrogenase (NADP+)
MTYGSSKWRAWVLDEEPSRPYFRRAWEAGINFFDTADVYSDGASEEVLGRALRDLAVPREQVAIATKVFHPMGQTANERGLSAKHIRHALDKSLKRLQLDYVDLYQIHRFDPSTPVEETLAALDGAVRAGKVLHVGASSMFAWQLAKLLHTSDRLGLARFVTMQNHWNLVYREEAGNRGAKGEGETTRARTDDFAHKMYYQESDYTVVERVAAVAKARGVSNAQVALAWLLHQPGVTAPVVGASKPHHLDDALAAVELKLAPAELQALEEPYRPHPVLGHS